MTPEGRVKNSICSWLSYQRCFFFIHDSVGIYSEARGRFLVNKSPYRVKGVSDILGIWKGKFLAIEVKSETGRLSIEQKNFITRVNEEGGIAFMARSIEDCVKILKEERFE